MAGYVTLPADGSSAEAIRWIDLALTEAAALPPKQPKAAKAKR